MRTVRGVLVSGIDVNAKALGRKWGFGIYYAGMFSLKNTPGNFAALGTATGHPELTGSTPFIAFGLSTGGGFVTKMAELYPSQMFAFVGNNIACSF